ncbi:MAG: alcohol dehydrogenase [Tardiphaga sp.]|uniref:c-type cytochrome n=1 Tax=Tardiphaga sp. TaxID=1926292 RepID=UPI00263193C4|nr:cytochrome c [Tardiphaga sp.]MDB5500902.1 alcohol dehydrogenase [Tardiphaga sp.]
MKYTSFAAGAVLAASVFYALPAHAQQPDADTAQIAKGAYLARAGDCVACHTAPGGKPFAGGLVIDSDVGRIVSTNITPDRNHGIGAYTEAQFSAALRDGIRSDGAHLYPAMPYSSYSNVTDEDVHALYAYFMKGVAPAADVPAKTVLHFPFSQRWGMVLWNAAFADTRRFQPDPKASAEFNRGAYLVEGLGHCGSCHTPRGIAMQENGSDASSASFLTGGELNGWPVPSLRGSTAASKGFVTWSEAEIVDYLGTGRNAHAAVGGEMKPAVEHSLSYLTDPDLRAIAIYLKGIAARTASTTATAGKTAATTAKLSAARDLTPGERLYLDNCNACHFVGGQGAARVFPSLDGASIVNAESPTGLIRTILGGAATPSTSRSPSILPMPGFAYRLSDQEVADLASFVRSGWTNQATAVTASQVGTIRATLGAH